MFNRKTIASILIFAGSALCFLLPFVTVSCGDRKVATFTGQQLATGTQITEAQPFGGTSTQKFPANPAAGVVALCALAGVGLSFAGKKLAAGTAGAGGAGVIALLLMKSRLEEQVHVQGGGFAQVSFEPGFVIAFLLLAAGTAWNVYLIVQRRTQSAASTPENGQPTGFAEIASEHSSRIQTRFSQQHYQTPEENMPDQKEQSAGLTGNVRFCPQCGKQLASGKRFCSQCGCDMQQRQASLENKKAAQPESSIQPRETSVVVPPSTATWREPANASPDRIPFERQDSAATSASSPASASRAAGQSSARDSANESIDLGAGGTRAKWIAITSAVLVALAAGGFWALHSHQLKTAPSPSTTSVPPASASGPAPSGAVDQASVPIQPPAPSNSTTRGNEPSVKPAKASAANAAPARPEKKTGAPTSVATSENGQHSAQLSSPPVYRAPLAQPAPAATSGTLHYSGPPVPMGGSVTFSHLPGGRLQFIFDHSAWQPLISRQPDGTKTLTLRSIRPEAQTKCDVNWQLVE